MSNLPSVSVCMSKHTCVRAARTVDMQRLSNRWRFTRINSANRGWGLIFICTVIHVDKVTIWSVCINNSSISVWQEWWIRMHSHHLFIVYSTLFLSVKSVRKETVHVTRLHSSALLHEKLWGKWSFITVVKCESPPLSWSVVWETERWGLGKMGDDSKRYEGGAGREGRLKISLSYVLCSLVALPLLH